MNTTSSSSDLLSNELIDAVVDTLSQGEALLQMLDDDVYSRKLRDAMHASIGGHFRHCLDHFICLMSALDTGSLNYDLRERDASLESDRFAAINMTGRIKRDFIATTEGLCNLPLQVSCKVNYDTEDAQRVTSCIERELMYVVAHTIHHYALIRLLAGLMDVTLPKDFGVSPSTVVHRSGK